LRVDNLTLERILPGVWEIISSGVPMVKRRNGAKVYLHFFIRIVFALLILYAIVGLVRETLSSPVLGQGGGTRQATSYGTSWGISGLEATNI
jgi:hypothetical protein